MTILWLIVLVIYGITAGFGGIHPLFWLLLIPLLLQDAWDRIAK